MSLYDGNQPLRVVSKSTTITYYINVVYICSLQLYYRAICIHPYCQGVVFVFFIQFPFSFRHCIVRLSQVLVSDYPFRYLQGFLYPISIFFWILYCLIFNLRLSLSLPICQHIILLARVYQTMIDCNIIYGQTEY